MTIESLDEREQVAATPVDLQQTRETLALAVTTDPTRLPELEAVEGQIAALRIAEDRRAAAARADARCQGEQDADERAWLLEVLIACFDILDQYYFTTILTCGQDRTRASFDAVVVQSTQRADLGKALGRITGQRSRFERRYDALDQIELHGGAEGKHYVLTARTRRPVVPRPWADYMVRFEALMPQQTPAVGNGG